MNRCPACQRDFPPPANQAPPVCPHCGTAAPPPAAASWSRSSPPAVGNGDTIELACPSCGTVYHLGRDALGKTFRCPNRICGCLIEVSGSAAGDDQSPLEAELVESAAATPAEVLDAELADVETLSAQVVPPAIATVASHVPTPAAAAGPSSSTQHPAAGTPGATTNLRSVPDLPSSTSRLSGQPTPGTVAASPPRGDRAARRRALRREVRGRRLRRIAIMASLGMLLAAGLLFWCFIPADFWGPDIDQRWSDAMTPFQEHRWSVTRRALDKFAAEFPDDRHTAMVPFFQALCDAGDNVYSMTGDATAGLAAIRQIFQDYRDSPAYREYSIEIVLALARLIERFVEQAKAGANLDQLAQARDAATLLATAAQSRSEPWVAERTVALTAQIDDAGRAIQTVRDCDEALRLLTAAQDPQFAGNPDDLYAQVDALAARQPALAADPELLRLRKLAYLAEAARVRYQAEAADPSPAATPLPPDYDRVRQGHTLAVVWGAAGPPRAEAADRPVMSLARGVLYVFDADGRLRWARRLGYDAARLPDFLPASAAAPATLLALAPDDNTLLALDAATGQLRWRYQVAGGTTAPPLIVPRGPGGAAGRLALLPTAAGEIHVLELARGRRVGRVLIGQPLSVGGAYDRQTGLAYFPAAAKRIFAVDPAALDDSQRPVCPSLLITGHPSGAIRSPPAVVGPYLIVCEAAGLEQTQLRAFAIVDRPSGAGPSLRGFSDPTARPLREFPFHGWMMSSPYVAADRIAVSTDRGEFGVLGVNLDNVDEALFPLVDGPPLHLPPAPGADAARTLVVDCQDNRLWLLAGGGLHKLAIDVVAQAIRPLWTGPQVPHDVAGIAAHEAQTGADGTFYVTTMSPSGQLYQAAGVEPESGRARWQRRLGLAICGDPLVSKDARGRDRVVMIDAGGQTFDLPTDASFAATELPRIDQRPGGAGPPPQADDRQLTLLGEPGAAMYLCAPIGDGRQAAVCEPAVNPAHSGAAPAGQWNTLPLPDRLAGQPCVAAGALVAPCADGQIYRVPLDPAARAKANDVSATWLTADLKAAALPRTAAVYALGAGAVLLVSGERQLDKFELTADAKATQLRRVGTHLRLERPIRGRPLLTGGFAYAFDAAGTLYQVDLGRTPGRLLGKWPLGLDVTAGPVVRGDTIVAVVGQRRLACLPLPPPATLKQPTWLSAEFSGRIRGLPTLADGVLLVADDSRRLSGVRLADGQLAWQTLLPVPVGPAAAPVAFGPGRTLVPLADGTLYVVATAATVSKETP